MVGHASTSVSRHKFGIACKPPALALSVIASLHVRTHREMHGKRFRIFVGNERHGAVYTT